MATCVAQISCITQVIYRLIDDTLWVNNRGLNRGLNTTCTHVHSLLPVEWTGVKVSHKIIGPAVYFRGEPEGCFKLVLARPWRCVVWPLLSDGLVWICLYVRGFNCKDDQTAQNWCVWLYISDGQYQSLKGTLNASWTTQKKKKRVRYLRKEKTKYR